MFTIHARRPLVTRLSRTSVHLTLFAVRYCLMSSFIRTTEGATKNTCTHTHTHAHTKHLLPALRHVFHVCHHYTVWCFARCLYTKCYVSTFLSLYRDCTLTSTLSYIAHSWSGLVRPSDSVCVMPRVKAVWYAYLYVIVHS